MAVTPPTYTPPPTSAPSPTSTNPTDPAGILTQLRQNYATLGVQPTGPGSGPTDINYYAQKVAETGGLTPNNISYWFGPGGRIASDLAAAKGGGGATAQRSSAASPFGTLGAAPTWGSSTTSAPAVGGADSFTSPGYSPIIPISGLMGKGPFQ